MTRVSLGRIGNFIKARGNAKDHDAVGSQIRRKLSAFGGLGKKKDTDWRVRFYVFWGSDEKDHLRGSLKLH